MSQNFYSVVLLYGGLPLPLQTVLYGVVHVTYSHVHLYIASCLHRQKVNQEDRVLKWRLGLVWKSKTRRGLKGLKSPPYSILNKEGILAPPILSGFEAPKLALMRWISLVLPFVWILPWSKNGWPNPHIRAAHLNLHKVNISWWNSRIVWSCFSIPMQRMRMIILQTACSKSPDIPMESSNCSVGMSRALQTSSLQLTNACIQSTQNNRLWKPTQNARCCLRQSKTG
jgi:hypothetical protein